MKSEKKSFLDNIKRFLFLHGCILFYSTTLVLSKYASMFDFLSIPYILLMMGMVLVLGIYAILWQQVIKYFSPSVAYSNKSVTTIWVLFFSYFLFNEGITLNNVIGALLIIFGVIMVSQDDK